MDRVNSSLKLEEEKRKMGIFWPKRGEILFAALTLLAASAGAQINIIPKPNQMTPGTGNFTVPATVIISADAQSAAIVPWVAKLFEQAGVPTQSGTPETAHINLTMNSALATLGTEGYTLDVTATKITISSSTRAGQFYGLQSLRQLLPPEVERGPSAVTKPIAIPTVSISDKPRFGYRGSMLDVARHFSTLTYLKQHIDRMALFKLNRFHIHLTDDQGWRLEIKAFPALTDIGGQTQVGGQTGKFYYTQEEMKGLIKYAADRNIVIVPEFDMPGHTGALFVSLPRLAGCASPDLAAGKVYTGITTNWSSLCVGGYGPAATQKYTDSVLAVVFKEIFALFPDEYVNIGGDEADPTRGAPFNTFIGQMEKLFADNGKKMVGWEEIAGGRKVASTWTLAWNHTGAGDINSNCEYQFIDHANNPSDAGAMGWCATQVTLQNVYSTPMVASNKGVESCLWSEYVTDAAVADKRFFPRTLGTAEAGWAAANNNWTEFRARLTPFGKRFDAMGIKFFSTEGAWDRGAAQATASSVYDNFVPTPVGIKERKVWLSQNAERSLSGSVFGIQGRAMGAIVNGGPSAIAPRSRGYGVYFIVEEKSNAKRKDYVKLLPSE